MLFSYDDVHIFSKPVDDCQSIASKYNAQSSLMAITTNTTDNNADNNPSVNQLVVRGCSDRKLHHHGNTWSMVLNANSIVTAVTSGVSNN